MSKSVGERSLSRQIATIVLVAQLCCALGLAAATLAHEYRTRTRAFDVQMQGRSDSLLGAIQDAEDPGDNVIVDPSELRLPLADVYAVYDQTGRSIGTSVNAPAPLIQLQTDGARSVRAGGVSYRVFQRSAMRIIDRSENGGVGLRRPVIILYASAEGQIWREVLEAASYSLIAIAFAAACSVALVLILLGRALRPLQELVLAAGEVTPTNLTFEAPRSVLKLRELQPLGDVLTSTVDGLRAAFENEKRFFGDAAHELKTAIAVVRSSLQVLMLRERSVAEYKAGLERALTDNDRVEALVTQMLRLAGTEEAGPLEGATVDLAQVVVEVCAFLLPFAESRGVRIETKLQSPATVPLQTEHGSALVSNLLMNAIQHSAPGAAVCAAVKTVGRQVQLEVSDHGLGIGEAALPHVFERFYREDTSRSRATGGAGLGLSICKAIADHAGATISVASSSGAGTTFVVIFSQA